MKNRKILSLLLALVLVFSAAGTAFAASGSLDTSYGTLTGNTVYTASSKTVGIRTTISNGNSSRFLENGIQWITVENGIESDITIDSSANGATCFLSSFPLGSASVLGWTPIGAIGHHYLVLDLGSGSRRILASFTTRETWGS